MPFSDKLLDYLHAVSAVWGSGVSFAVSKCKYKYVMGLNIQSVSNVQELRVFN